jgi:hypothetical protein
VAKKEEKIAALGTFYATMKKDWAVVNDRVIGHIVWAPPITGLDGPDGYTVDVCVIELDANKFRNWRGNVIDLDTY